MPPSRTAQICVDLDPPQAPSPMGVLRCQTSGRGDLFSFAYDVAWLRERRAFAFDPDLALASGPQYPGQSRDSFGMLMDSAPDRWGRLLMQRRENLQARKQARRPRALTEWDFVLGVHDETRLGALRFRFGEGQAFKDDEVALAAPPLATLRELQVASHRFEEHEANEAHPHYARWLAQLFAPGSSLGGARPKACVRDESGALCLAKFPSKHDTHDVGAWELVAHRLAERAGITVPEARPVRMTESPYTTFLATRFDRDATQRRLPFVSAMTLTQRIDGEPGGSYLELVEILQTRGLHARVDCEQLFRRVLFNILIHNTDDHLRNHGFLLYPAGVRLAPAYDVNPSIERDELSLAINEVEATCDVGIAMDTYRDYGLTAAKAKAMLVDVRKSVSQWRRAATHFGISKSEQGLMAPAFEEG
jgi:serine/threonine-protein kinase HipA